MGAILASAGSHGEACLDPGTDELEKRGYRQLH